MMRSLYSGVSGLRVHQTKMDVIGNNIANVNTVAYKSSNVTFSEVFYQTTQAASGANEASQKGGTNAKQIGLGSNVGAISSTITSEGANQRTDNAFDLKINGEAFFVVQSNGKQLFTRAGNFKLDDAGYLVTPTGALVMGWQIDPDSGEVKKDTVSALQPKSSDFMYTMPEATTAYTVTGNINKNDSNFVNGDAVPMSVHFYDSLGNEYTANINVNQSATNVNEFNLTLGDIYCNNKKTNLVAANTDLGTIAFDANTGKPTGGTADPVTGDMIYQFEIGGLSAVADVTAYNTAQTANDPNFKPLTQEDWDKMFIASTAMTFPAITVDYSGMTSLADETNPGGDFGIKGIGGGKPVGKMTGISVAPDGTINGSYSNGDTKILGQIAVATFVNPAGLSKEGDNYYAATLNSGLFDGIGVTINAAGGSINAGVLEMSNVDLSLEFTEMITTQRGFQANSRIITVSDTLIEELVNLKR